MRHAPLGPHRQPCLTPLAARLAASSFTALLTSPAVAQIAAAPATSPESDVADTAAAPAQRDDSLNLERVVITATSEAKTNLRSAMSVTTVDDNLVKAMNTQTQSEVLRLIPGIVDQAATVRAAMPTSPCVA